MGRLLIRTVGKNLFLIYYLLASFLISIPFNYANFQLLFTEDGLPTGADSAFHTYSILTILDTKDPLIPYTAFPSIYSNSSSYYPSLMHISIAIIANMASLNQSIENDPSIVIEVEKSFLMTISLAGTLGYALFIKCLIDMLSNKAYNKTPYFLGNLRHRILYLTISILAFGIFINSVSPVIKTYNDGTYAQIFAMWSIFPFYMYCLVNGRWTISAILLAAITSAHNLAFLMTLAATIPYLISLILQRAIRKYHFFKFAAVFVIFALPALVLFYIPAFTSVLDQSAAQGVYSSWSRTAVLVQLKPALFYAGIVCTALALLINYRVLGWLVGWVLIYFIIIDLSSTLGARFARELSVIFGILVGTVFAHLLFVLVAGRWRQLSINSIRIDKNYIGSARLVMGVVTTGIIILLSYWYFLDYFQGASNPKTVKYFTEEMETSNRYFLTAVDNKNASGTDKKMTIALFGDNPWLKVMTYGHYDVLGIQPMNTGSLAKKGSSVNDELHQLVSNYDEESIACTIKKYDVDYLYISDKIPGRWYNPAKSDNYYRELSNFPSGHQSALFDLDADFIGKSGEYLRIFSIKSENVDRLCG